MKLERINLIFGLVLLVVFLLTGYYMGSYFKPNNLENYTMRLQIRSNHIYILYLSLLNILSFKTAISTSNFGGDLFNLIIRILLLCSGGFSFIAFLFEHTGDISKRILTLITAILALTAVGLFLINELLNSKTHKNEKLQ